MHKINILITIFILLFSLNSFAGINQDMPIPDSDSNGDGNFGLMAFFDLRDRESFIQITNNDSSASTYHVQIFNVSQNCNENDFFDVFTVNDTHVYNMRDITTNDGNPSGVVLPENSYGIVAVSPVNAARDDFDSSPFIGNFRILDDSGYEYRTNMSGYTNSTEFPDLFNSPLTFNFSKQAGINFSDVVGIFLVEEEQEQQGEWSADNITTTFVVMDVDIYDLNENPLSCRDIAFSCIQPDSPFVEELLANDVNEGTNGANVASFEYGINESIPHTKNGELLCPGNNIDDGFVTLNFQGISVSPQTDDVTMFNVFVGLNNGDGRGSMDAIWWRNDFVLIPSQ